MRNGKFINISKTKQLTFSRKMHPRFATCGESGVHFYIGNVNIYIYFFNVTNVTTTRLISTMKFVLYCLQRKLSVYVVIDQKCNVSHK